jgi:hypothetical protein
LAKLPPLLTERSRGTEFALLVVVPSVGGLVGGVLLGTSEIGYLVYAVLAIGAGYLGGLEHLGGWNGFYRGLIGGMEFGVWILIGHGVLFDEEPKAELPDPEILLVVITTVLGCLLGALGGRRRARLELAKGA